MPFIIHHPSDTLSEGDEIIGVVVLDKDGNIHVTERAFDLILAEVKEQKLYEDVDYED